MAISATEIDAVLLEAVPLLAGGWVQKVHQPTPTTVTLEIRSRGRTHLLLLAFDPETARLHMLTQRLPNPAVPPPFCQYLRAHIQGGHIDAIERVGGDRIVRIELATAQGALTLVAALTGRSADCLILDGAGKILTTLLHGQQRAGQQFVPPSRPTSHAVDAIPDATLEHAEDAPFPVSSALERRYMARERELAVQRLRQARLTQVRKAIKKASRRLQALEADLQKAERYRGYARYGELLKANLAQMGKGQDQVTVVDYFDAALPELVIPLDPAKTPRGNMEDYFRKHRKHLSAEREIRPRQQDMEKLLEELNAELRSLTAGTWQPPTSSAPLPHARARTTAGPQRRERLRAGPFRRFVSSDGLTIYVGKNARENEELTHKFARSDDLWLHLRGAPGSHVVVRLDKGTDPPPETLRDAAVLALLYSDLKKSGKGEVIYTRKKWVRKAKGQAPGTVTVTREKALWVTLDKVRLEALKERSR